MCKHFVSYTTQMETAKQIFFSNCAMLFYYYNFYVSKNKNLMTYHRNCLIMCWFCFYNAGLYFRRKIIEWPEAKLMLCWEICFLVHCICSAMHVFIRRVASTLYKSFSSTQKQSHDICFIGTTEPFNFTNKFLLSKEEIITIINIMLFSLTSLEKYKCAP